MAKSLTVDQESGVRFPVGAPKYEGEIMTYICIRCRKVWVVDHPTDEYSGGLCDKCIIRYVRDKQSRLGYHDCFGRATEVCGETRCRYIQACLKVSGVE